MPFPASVSGSSGMIWQATVHENIYVGIVLSLYMYMWKNEKQIKQDVQLPNIEMTRKLQGENNPPPSEVWRKPLYTFGRSVRFPPTSFSSQEGRFSLRFPESKKNGIILVSDWKLGWGVVETTGRTNHWPKNNGPGHRGPRLAPPKTFSFSISPLRTSANMPPKSWTQSSGEWSAGFGVPFLFGIHVAILGGRI